MKKLITTVLLTMLILCIFTFSVCASEYKWDFEGTDNPGISAWDGHHSLSFSDGFMVITRASTGDSGGIDVTPQETLAASDYPYMVIKVLKPENGQSLSFNTYYVTGDMTNITGDGLKDAYKADYEDSVYDYYVTDFSSKTEYSKGNIKKFVFTVGNVGKWEIEEIRLTSDLSFLYIETETPVTGTVKTFQLDGEKTIDADSESIILAPFIEYADGTVETDFSKIKYATDTVNGLISVNEDGTLTVEGRMNGELNITAILPEYDTKITETVTISNQEPRIPTGDIDVVMYGNSIRAHPPAPSIGWPEYADWGMAASSTDKDYAHRFLYYMEQKYGKGNVTLHPSTSIATFEWAIAGKGDNYDYSTDAEILQMIDIIIEKVSAADADIVTFQMGENVGYAVTYLEYFHATEVLVNAVKEAFPDTLIVVCTSFWGGENRVKAITQTAKTTGVPIANLHTLATRENYAWDAEWLKDAIDGVKNHPGDGGMDNIAKLIFEQTNMNLSTVVLNDYTSLPASAEIIQKNPEITSEYGTLQLNAKIYPEDAAQDVIWTTSNKNIATVDESGLVKAVNNGTVKITATSKLVDTVFAEVEVAVSGQTIPYTVTYDQNSTDTVANMPSANTLAKEQFVFDTVYPVRSKYRFLGWSLTPDGEVIDGTYITEDTTVYAIWEKAYRWDWSRDGYKEDFTADNGFNQYVTGGKYMAIATDTNLETGEVLTFKSPEIDINPADYKILAIRMENSDFASDTSVILTLHTKNGDVTLSQSITQTSRTEYAFSLESVSGTITSFEFNPTNIDCTVLLDSIEFCNEPSLIFNVGNADASEVTGLPSAVYENNNGYAPLPENIPSRAGYTFLGWSKDPDSKLLVDGKSVKTDAALTLYAVWDKNDHFEFDSMDDYNMSSMVEDETYISDGILYMTTYRADGVADPIISPKNALSYTAESTSGKVEFRMKWSIEDTAGHTQIYYTTTAGPNLSEGNSAHVKLNKPVSDGFENKTIDLGAISTWTGDIKSFRFDPYNVNGKAEIDYIRFTDSEANITTESGETRKLTVNDKAYHIVRTGGTLAPVGCIEVENLALSGDIDMKNGCITVTDKAEIADTADYAVYPLDMSALGITAEDSFYISGCETEITPVNGAKYIIKTYNGTGFVAYRKKGTSELTVVTVNTKSSDEPLTFITAYYNSLRVSDTSITESANETLKITLNGDFTKLITVNNTKSFTPVFGAITIK